LERFIRAPFNGVEIQMQTAPDPGRRAVVCLAKVALTCPLPEKRGEDESGTK